MRFAQEGGEQKKRGLVTEHMYCSGYRMLLKLDEEESNKGKEGGTV